MKNIRLFILYFLLLAFSLYSGMAVYHYGYFGVWKVGFSNLATAQILFDLGISLFLVGSWMIGDAKARQKTILPWLLATVAIGSIAPLLYLILREHEKQKSKEPQVSPEITA